MSTATPCAPAAHGGVDVAEELHPVGQSGERIVQRQIGQLLLGDPQRGHVLDEAGEAVALTLVVEHRSAQSNPPGFHGIETELDPERMAALRGGPRLAQPFGIAGVRDRGPQAAERGVLGPIVDQLPPVVDVHQPSVGIGEKHPDGSIVDHRVELEVEPACRTFGPPQLRRVGELHEELRAIGAAGEDHREMHHAVQYDAVCADQPARAELDRFARSSGVA